MVIKPVPAGATAVGIPARIIPSKQGESADVTELEASPAAPKAAAPQVFTAYGVTQEDDPVSQAMKGLAEGAATHEQQLQLLWQVLEKLSAKIDADCMPCASERQQRFEKDRIDQILGK